MGEEVGRRLGGERENHNQDILCEKKLYSIQSKNNDWIRKGSQHLPGLLTEGQLKQ